MRGAPLEPPAGSAGAGRGAVTAIEQLLNNLLAALQSAAGAFNSLPPGRPGPDRAPADTGGCAPQGPCHGADGMRNELQGIMQLLHGLLSTMMQLLNALKTEHDATRPRGGCIAEGLQQADGG